jgi:hypothetical protein
VNVIPEQFNRAFAEFQAFGSRRRIPIEKRWREILPDVASDEFAALKTQCKEIEAFALNLAEQVRERKISDEIAQKQFSEKYPFLTRERLGHTWSQAVYFSLK